MRELDDRYARDGTGTAADAPGRHVRDSHQPRREEAFDAAARLACALEYRQRVDAVYAAYEAKHAKPQDARPDHALDVNADRPAARIADRELPEHKEGAWKRKQERSWLPSNEISQVAVSVDALFSVVNASYHVIPGKIEGIAAAALGVVVAGVAWANKRWKDKHGDRPEG